MTTTLTLRTRSRPFSGPAMLRHPWPVRSLVLSSIAHALAVGAIIAVALLWRPEPTRTYVVNLTPSVPAVGSPTGKATTTPAPRVEPPARPTKSAAIDTPAPPAVPPARRVAPELPARDPAARPARPAAPPELPARAAPRMADTPAREVPRSGQKELPVLDRPSPPAPSASKAGPAMAPREVAPPPPPLGRPTGMAQGAGAAASVEGDFPFQWYLSAVQRKIHEQWVQPLSSLQGQRAVITFEIARNGEVSRARIEKTSGDAAYDMAALRAVTAANPLPPLPAEFKGTVIRVHFGFEYTGRG